MTLETGRRRWRSGLAAAALAAGCLLVALAIIAVWLNREISDTDTYVATIAPLAADPAVQNAAAARLSQEIVSRAHIEDLTRKALPERAGFLAPVLTQGLQGIINNQIRAVIASDRFQRFWTEANRASHQLAMKVLLGTGGGAVTSSQGTISVDLGALLGDVRRRLDQRGITALDGPLAGGGGPELTLLQSAKLAAAQRWLRLLDRLAWILPLAATALLAAALWLSPRRRRTLLTAGIGVAVCAALILVGLATARSYFLDSLPGTNVSPGAAAAVIDAFTASLKTAFRATFALGIVTAGGAFIAGPSALAVTSRRQTAAVMKSVASRTPTPLSAWVLAHMAGLRTGGLIAALILLIAADHPTLPYLVFTAAGLAAYLLLLELLGGRWRE